MCVLYILAQLDPVMHAANFAASVDSNSLPGPPPPVTFAPSLIIDMDQNCSVTLFKIYQYFKHTPDSSFSFTYVK